LCHGSAYDRTNRNACISRAYLECGFTMKQIGDFLGLHYTTISVVIRDAEQRTL